MMSLMYDLLLVLKVKSGVREGGAVKGCLLREHLQLLAIRYLHERCAAGYVFMFSLPGGALVCVAALSICNRGFVSAATAAAGEAAIRGNVLQFFIKLQQAQALDLAALQN